jgi:hypothetical protein
MVVNLIIETKIRFLYHFDFSKNTSNIFLHLTVSRNVNSTQMHHRELKKHFHFKCLTYDYITKPLRCAKA